MERILITGHTGMLGRSVVDSLLQEGRYEIFGVSKTSRLEGVTIREYQVDLTDEMEVRTLLSNVRPDVIIHTAAYTNLQFCESNMEEAYQLHVNLTRTLAGFENVRFCYVSTDSVFNGEKGTYKETDPTYPVNYYALSKLQGECAALSENRRSLVIRTNMYGFRREGGNSLAEWAINSFKGGKGIKGFSDVYFNPLYVGQLARLILRLISMDQHGILHTGVSESYSKLDFLQLLAHEFGYPRELVAESPYLEDKRLRRPKNTTLNIDYLKQISGEIPSLKTGIRMFKSDYLKSL